MRALICDETPLGSLLQECVADRYTCVCTLRLHCIYQAFYYDYYVTKTPAVVCTIIVIIMRPQSYLNFLKRYDVTLALRAFSLIIFLTITRRSALVSFPKCMNTLPQSNAVVNKPN